MSRLTSLSFPRTFYLSATISAAVSSLVISYFVGVNISTSAVGQIVHQSASNMRGLMWPNPNYDGHQYQVQLFSIDPLVIVVESFLSKKEIDHLLHLSEHKFKNSKVYSGYKESRYDPDYRISESAKLDRNDKIVRRIENRAQKFQGWRGNNTRLDTPTIQRYYVDGFYSYHYDWDPTLTKGNRATTFMVYLVADCAGGGTNFPYLKQPDDMQWCNIIECTEEGRDGYQGVTFKPKPGLAVYWENFHPNGSGHEGVYHAGLPVKSGVKVGLNIWSWDSAWTRPEGQFSSAT